MKECLSGLEQVIGLDEVGRGALAGPVVVGAVLIGEGLGDSIISELQSNCQIRLLKDSKKMSVLARERVYNYLEDRLNWSVGLASVEEIDLYKLTKALKMATDRAISKLRIPKNCRVLIKADAGIFHSQEDRYETLRYVRGDEKYLEIMLASIMAKVWRDRLMAQYSQEGSDYAGYGWERNAGYGTLEHRKMIELKGLTDLHRMLFCSTYLARSAKLG